MADFYQEMADMVRDLLSPTSAGGLGQGAITLVRVVQTPNPAQPWEPPTQSTLTETETLKGAVSGIDRRLVGTEAGGAVILESDRIAICEVPAMSYQAGDVLQVDGVPVHILSVGRIPAAGITAAVQFIIRG